VSNEDLLNTLNGYPIWVPPDQLDQQTRSNIYQAISALSEAFQRAGLEGRKSITEGLGRSAKYVMYEYTRDKAVEARRTGSETAIIEGLIPVVMAGGRSDTATGGSLLSMLFRSAETSQLNTSDLFAHAAQFATDEESGAQIRGFPLLSPKMRSIARFGIRERRTREGVIYETPGEWMARPRWWDKLIGRRRASHADTLEVLRRIEEAHHSSKK